MKKTQEDSLKKELDKGNNFVDYFVIIGLKQDLIFDDFLYENDIKVLNSSPLINPEILTKFPPFDKTTINIDENMIRHIFPSGYQIKESTTPLNPECFCLILDNNFFSINFPQKYISCLIFYESITTYRKIYDKYKSYEDEDRTRENTCVFDNSKFSTATRVQNDDISSNSIVGLNNYTTNFTKSKLSETDKLSQLANNYIIDENQNCRDSSIEYFKSRDTFSDNLRNTKNYFTSNTYAGAKYKNYYAPKCICLVSVYPFFVEFSKILKSIYKCTKYSKFNKPLEKIIENLVIEVPVPPRGFYSVEYYLFSEKYTFTQSPMNQLPFISIEFEKIFINFKIEQILEIYKHVLMETRILFFSSDISNLTPFIQGFLSLIYPFKYPFQYVTILPEENFNFIESISPYIIGINKKYQDNFFVDTDIDIENLTILIVDIDNRKIEVTSPEINKIDLINTKRKYMLEEFPDLPKHYKNKLISKIEEYIERIKSNAKHKEDTDIFSNTIRNYFFQFIVNILQNYYKFLNNDYYTKNEISSPTIYSLFKVDDFINSTDHSDRPFFKKLVKETQLFVEFILKRMIPKDGKDKLEILFFDENLMEKNSRRLFGKKAFTPFIHCNLYDYRHIYSVQKNRGFLEEEIAYFRENLSSRKEALRCGQEILFIKNKISVSYPIFPFFMNDVFFKNNIKLYYLPPNLSEELETFNVDIVSKSHLGSVSLHYSEMENYIYLCWIQLWAMTFWYHDEVEKRFRFQELLMVLDLVINHEMEIFNLLFEALSKYAEDYNMILKLYERLVYYKLNPSYSICTTVMKLIDKKQLLNNKVGECSIMKYVEKNEFKINYNHNQFKRRSLKNKFDLNIISEDVKFNRFDICIECTKEYDLEKLSRNFNNMRRDILWATCPNCQANLLPKISVRFGKEINSSECYKFNTSSIEASVLYSPFHLKYNYNNGLLKEYALKLDIESFKLKFNAIFWDSIWYFQIKNLPFDFMFPYENILNLDILKYHVERKFKLNQCSLSSSSNINTKNEKFYSTENCINIENSQVLSFKEMKSIDKANSLNESNYKTFSKFKLNSFKKFNSRNLVLVKTTDITFRSERKELSGKKINDEKENNNININDIENAYHNDNFELNEDAFNNMNDYFYNKNNLNSEYNAAVLQTEESYINPQNFIDNSTILDSSSRVLDTDQNSVVSDLESFRGHKKSYLFRKLKTIIEDADEILYEPKESQIRLTSKKSRPRREISSESSLSKQFSDHKEIIMEIESSSNKKRKTMKEDDRDKTPIKSQFHSNEDIVYILREEVNRTLRSRSIDKSTLEYLNSSKTSRKNSLQIAIDRIDII